MIIDKNKASNFVANGGEMMGSIIVA